MLCARIYYVIRSESGAAHSIGMVRILNCSGCVFERATFDPTLAQCACSILTRAFEREIQNSRRKRFSLLISSAKPNLSEMKRSVCFRTEFAMTPTHQLSNNSISLCVKWWVELSLNHVPEISGWKYGKWRSLPKAAEPLLPLLTTCPMNDDISSLFSTKMLNLLNSLSNSDNPSELLSSVSSSLCASDLASVSITPDIVYIWGLFAPQAGKDRWHISLLKSIYLYFTDLCDPHSRLFTAILRRGYYLR